MRTSKLAGLRRAVRRLERVELSEALRASEPVSIQMGATAESDRGVEQLREEEEDEDGGKKGAATRSRQQLRRDHVDTRPAKRHAAAAMVARTEGPTPPLEGRRRKCGAKQPPLRAELNMVLRAAARSSVVRSGVGAVEAGTRTHARLMEIAQMSAKQG